MSWRPTLAIAREAPLHKRLVEAIEKDIQSGVLAPDARMPPQRDLAHALSISVGAVTRAYDEAARRGLVRAHVGRGTFVVDRSHVGEGQAGPIDLSANIAPIQTARAMAEAIAALRRTPDWTERLGYQPPGGRDIDREAAAAWLARSAGFDGLDWRNLICCSGAQNAMAIALLALGAPGGPLLCEAASFPGIKTLADQLGCRLHGVEMDAQGADPHALDRAAAETGARVFYALPTLQNPTARTMGLARRADIVAVARARGVWIVEDDLYAPYARPLGLPPIATLAPELTLYVSSLSKILSPGLRAGYLVAPAGLAFDRCIHAVRALMHSPAGVGAAMATHWIQGGQADELAREILNETAARSAMAQTALAGAVDPLPYGTSLHLWLPMREIDAERTASRAAAAGLRLAPPAAFAVSQGSAPSGLRLCVGAAADRATLERALTILSGALSGEVDDRTRALV